MEVRRNIAVIGGLKVRSDCAAVLGANGRNWPSGQNGWALRKTSFDYFSSSTSHKFPGFLSHLALGPRSGSDGASSQQVGLAVNSCGGLLADGGNLAVWGRRGHKRHVQERQAVIGSNSPDTQIILNCAPSAAIS